MTTHPYCHVCNRTFGSDQALQQHLGSAPIHINVHVCEYCPNRKFALISALGAHVKAKHGQEHGSNELGGVRLAVETGGQSSSSKGGTEAMKDYTCKQCPNPRKFATISALEAHAKDKHGSDSRRNTFACAKCPTRKGFATYADLENHSWGKHNVGLTIGNAHVCKECPTQKEFTTSQALEAHVTSAHAGQSSHQNIHVCEHCPARKPFVSSSALWDHFKDKHADSHICKLCPGRKAFTSSGALQDHLKDKHSQGHTQDIVIRQKNNGDESREPHNDKLQDDTSEEDEPVKSQLQERTSPLDAFFRRYCSSGHVYDPSLPPEKSFEALQDHFRWNERQSRSALKQYQRALSEEVDFWYGSDKDIESWRTLFRALGIADMPESLTQRKKLVQTKHVNIVDLIHWGRSGGHGSVKVFQSVGALRRYTLENGKVYPLRDIKKWEEGGRIVLRHLLRRLL